jgi:hypothetical protein
MEKPRASSRLPVEQLAHALMAAAREGPALLSRTGTHPAGKMGGWVETLPEWPLRSVPLLPMQPLPGSQADSYFGQLLSIAATSASRAEGAAQQASAAGRTAKWVLLTAAGVGALGAVVGAAGVAENRRGEALDARLVAVAGQMHDLADAQQQSNDRLAEMRAATLGQPDVTTRLRTGDTACAPVYVTPTLVRSAAPVGRSADDRHPGDADAVSAQASGGIAARGGASSHADGQPDEPTVEVSEHPIFAAAPQQVDDGTAPVAPVIAVPLPAPATQPVSFNAPSGGYAFAPRVYASLSPKYQRRTGWNTSRASGNPAKDFHRLVVAVGQEFRAIFR